MGDPPDRFQLRVKAGTAVVTGVALATLLLFDWNRATAGHPTVFSGIRPAVKAALNRLYGVEPPQAQAQQQQTQQAQQAQTQQQGQGR